VLRFSRASAEMSAPRPRNTPAAARASNGPDSGAAAVLPCGAGADVAAVLCGLPGAAMPAALQLVLDTCGIGGSSAGRYGHQGLMPFLGTGGPA
jgi:hypothetical protein